MGHDNQNELNCFGTQQLDDKLHRRRNDNPVATAAAAAVVLASDLFFCSLAAYGPSLEFCILVGIPGRKTNGCRFVYISYEFYIL